MTAAPAPPAPTSKSARTRTRILDAAAVVFAEQGYGARLSDIAERAGIQTGSLYYHFASREELVTEILHLGIETSWGQVCDALDALPASATPLDRIATAVRAHTMSVLDISDYSAARARIVGHVPPAIASAHRRDQKAYGDFWNELFVAASHSGVLRPDVNLFAARMLAFGAMNWTAEWFEFQREVDAEAIADTAVAVLLGGLLAPDQSQGLPGPVD